MVVVGRAVTGNKLVLIIFDTVFHGVVVQVAPAFGMIQKCFAFLDDTTSHFALHRIANVLGKQCLSSNFLSDITGCVEVSVWKIRTLHTLMRQRNVEERIVVDVVYAGSILGNI